MRTEAQKLWYKNNRARTRERTRIYEAANPEKVKAWRLARSNREKARRAESPAPKRTKMSHDEKLEKKRQWYYANREKVLASQKKYKSTRTPQSAEQKAAHVRSTMRWAVKNHGKVRAIALRYYRNNAETLKLKQLPRTRLRRAKIAQATIGNIGVIAKWEMGWRKKKVVKCFWCQTSLQGKKGHVDHIVAITNGGAHEIGNLCISCKTCNLSKQGSHVEKWNSRISQPVLL